MLSVPCIKIRKNIEWTETVIEVWNMLTDTNTEQIVKYTKEWFPVQSQRKPIFEDGNTSRTIKSIILDIVK